MADFEKEVLGWEDEIESDEQFIKLEPGDYKFTISHYDKEHYVPKAGGKLPECDMAVVHFDIISPKGTTSIKDSFQLCSKMIWKISALYRAVGLKKHGEKVSMQWDKLPGLTGLCSVTLDEDPNDSSKSYNHISGYIDKDEEKEKGYSGDVDW